jgi:hypothetical protein
LFPPLFPDDDVTDDEDPMKVFSSTEQLPGLEMINLKFKFI